MLISEILKEKEEWKDEINKMANEKCPVILFGAGSTSEYNLKYFNKLAISPIAFCDNSIEKQGTLVSGVPVVSLEEAIKKYPDAYYYITTQLYYSEIKQQLIEAGCGSERISNYDIVFQFPWEKECISYYQKYAEKLEVFYNRLSDEKSKKVLKNRLLFLRTRNREYAINIRDGVQYFDEELIDFNCLKCFVDLGMYTGDTILKFLQYSGGRYNIIYGFEPDKNIHKMASDNLENYKNIICVNKATSDYNGQINIEQSLGVMQTIESGIYGAEKNERNVFEVCKLDSFFENMNPQIDMIKIDIEGAELATLKGASDIIKKNHPIIAVCIYHKQEDIFEIPEYIESLNLPYNLYLRHYSDNQTETVCYFLPKL